MFELSSIAPWLVILPCGIALALVLTVLLQGKLLFGFALKVRRATPGPSCAHRTVEPVWLARTDGAQLQGWLTVPTNRSPQRLLVWFGGRNEHVAWTPDLAGWLPEDCALLSFNYRSIGMSSGWPSESVCVADAEAIVAWGLDRLGLAPTALYVAGRSLGSGVAMQLAARLSAAGCAPASLALITPLQSMRAIVEGSPFLAPLTAFLRSPFDSVAVSGALSCDVLVLLAEEDRRVPHAHSIGLVGSLVAAGCAVSVEQIPATDHCSVARAPHAMHLLGRWLSPTPSLSN